MTSYFSFKIVNKMVKLKTRLSRIKGVISLLMVYFINMRFILVIDNFRNFKIQFKNKYEEDKLNR